MANSKANIIFIAVITLLSVGLLFIPTGFENRALTENILYEKAEIVDVDNSYLSSFSIVTTGTQEVTLKIKSGPFKGTLITSENTLIGQKKIDKIFEQGDRVLAVLQLNSNRSTIVGARAYDYYRHDIILVLLGLFTLFLFAFAKTTGLKAILSFLFTALVFWKMLLPMFLKGVSPVCVSMIVVLITSAVILLLVGGLTKKGAVALCGTMAGVVFTAVLAFGFGYLMQIPGTVQDYSETLLYAGFVNLNLTDIFLSVIFISAAGALMDTAMDISAAQNEIIERVPDISRRELIISGFRIASPVVGTMTTTLLFAYTGSFIFAFMAFMAQGTPFISIVNSGYIAAEIMHTLVGSFGLVLVAPLTAIIGGFIYK